MRAPPHPHHNLGEVGDVASSAALPDLGGVGDVARSEAMPDLDSEEGGVLAEVAAESSEQPINKSEHDQKALMNLPSTDLLHCVYLVPEEVRSAGPIRDLIGYAEHLESAKFVEFWEVANLGGNELLDGVPGLDEAVRAFMLNTLKNTYSTLESEHFMDLLALDDAHLEAYVGQFPDVMALASVGSGKKHVAFKPNPNNTPKPKKLQESVSIDRVLPIVRLLTSS